jgi:glycosyltransferase involved in cell wall biosynthesis
VVATDVGGFPEIIENKVNGLLVEAGDADSLADAIVEVLTNDELRDKIRINAHERIKSFCDAEKVALRSLEIYREVINL